MTPQPVAGVPFAFLGRVSTEDQQDPESSRAWQLGRVRALIEPHGGLIVAEFFDIGQSRSLPWRRRPQAAALLAALRDPSRGFDAVVIGEPQQAFYGNQFGLTFPLFVHHDVASRPKPRSVKPHRHRPDGRRRDQHPRSPCSAPS